MVVVVRTEYLCYKLSNGCAVKVSTASANSVWVALYHPNGQCLKSEQKIGKVANIAQCRGFAMDMARLNVNCNDIISEERHFLVGGVSDDHQRMVAEDKLIQTYVNDKNSIMIVPPQGYGYPTKVNIPFSSTKKVKDYVMQYYQKIMR